MNRNTPDYKEAIERVKVSFFTEVLGLDIHGIVHVGANDGYEMQWYQKMGITDLLGVEPLPAAQRRFKAKYPDIPLLPWALGQHDTTRCLHIPDTGYRDETMPNGDGQGSSLLHELNPPECSFLPDIQVKVKRWDMEMWRLHLKNQDAKMDCLVMDVQGYEMRALIGFGDQIQDFDMLSIELSEEPLYLGGEPAKAVCEYLASWGFRRMTRIEKHDDVFFVHERMFPKMRGLHLNIGSGDRPFGRPFLNIDCRDECHPDMTAYGAALPFADETVECIVLHRVLECLNLDEAGALLRECARLLSDSGKILIFTPDFKMLARMWISGEMSDADYTSIICGSKWGYSTNSLWQLVSNNWLCTCGKGEPPYPPGANIEQEKWILGLEARP